MDFDNTDLLNGNLIGTLKSENGKEIPIELDSYIPIVKENLCRGCGDCVTVCEYDAMSID